MTQPTPQRFVRDIRPDLMPKPVCIDDATGRIVQTESVSLINAQFLAAEIEGRDVELMPVHEGRDDRLPDSPGHGNVMNSWNDVSQFVSSKRREQAQGWPMRFRCDLDKVIIDWLAVGATVQAAPDSFHRA